MRRKEREVTELNELISIIDSCEVCRIAMIDNGIPYIVPMNFGYELVDKNLSLYFHCAKVGRKIDVLKGNPNVCFEMDSKHELVTGENACDYTYNYQSIIGNGTVEFIEDFEEKKTGLTIIMKKFSQRENFHFSEQSVNNVTVFKIASCDFSGKKH